MAFKVLIPFYTQSPYTIIEIDDPGGLNTRDKALSRTFDETNSMQNFLIIGRGIEKRPGSAVYGSAQTGTKVVGLSFLEQDSGITPLMVVNQTLYKYSSGWSASDKTNYSANLDTSIQTFTSKSGNSLDNGTTTSGTTNYYVEDTGKTWTKGVHRGRCVVIQGEVKLITDNDATKLFLADKLNSDTNSDYQTKAYNIFAVSPFAFVANGIDYVQKYDLTTTVAIDGTQVTSGVALPIAKFLSVHQGRLVISNGVGNNNDKIFLTDAGLGENITTDTNVAVNTQFFNDGDQVNCHGSMPLDNGSVLIIAKDNSVHALDGDNILNYNARLVSRQFGCIAPKTFRIYGQSAFMLSNKGVIAFSSQQNPLLNDPLPISQPIQSDIDAKTSSELANACAAIYKNRYYLQIGSSAWYYDLEASVRQNQHIWVDLNFPYAFNILEVINNVLYGGDQASGQAYTLLTGTQDGSTNITALYESGEISLSDVKALDRRIGGRPQVWVERVEFTVIKDSATVLRFQVATDGGDYGTVQSLTASRDDQRYPFTIAKRCYSFKFKLTENGSNTPVRIMMPIRLVLNTSEYGESGTKD